MAEAETTSFNLRWDLGPWPVRERLGALKVVVLGTRPDDNDEVAGVGSSFRF